MKQLFIFIRTLITCLFIYSIAIAQSPAELPVDQSKLIQVPLLLKPDANNPDAAVGGVIVEPTTQAENALDQLRDSLHKMEGQAQQKNSERGWFKSVNYRFTPENLTFFTAIGLVTFNSIWIKSAGDPLAMEKHILSIKDPIAWVSFYSFMLANGFYIDLKSKNMDPVTKQQMMRRLSYQGMAVGSLASSIISDLGHSGQMCIDHWIMGRDDAQSVESCNEAWKHWTARNKFQQYFPQIIAMWASQAVTEVIDSRIVRPTFKKLTTIELGKKLFTKKTLVNAVKKITAADAIISFTGGTWSMRSLRWAGKVTQFAMFVEIDSLMSPFTYRPMNNVIRPALFDFDALAINNFWSAADQINWDDQRLSEANKKVCTGRYSNCLEKKLVGEIENFGFQMQQWREHLNSDAETDMAGWLELTKKLLNQVDYSYKFYNSFVSNLFETLNIGSRIHPDQDQDLSNNAAKNISQFPFRKLPLYGVSVGEYKTQGGPVEDLYLTATAELESKQKEHILNVVREFEKSDVKIDRASSQKLISILNQLKNQSTDQVGNTLIEINQILDINTLKDNSSQKVSYSQDLINALTLLRKAIGNPMPIVNHFASFSQAFAANSIYASITDDADFRLWSFTNKYMFNKETDLMTYKIFCGNSQSHLDRTSVKPIGANREFDFISPQFDPPRLLRPSAELNEYCSQWRKTRELKIFNENLYGQNIAGLSMRDFFIKNFDYSIIGDFTKKENARQFDKWWLENGRKPMDEEFKKFDKIFKNLVETTKQNIFDQKTYFNWFVDHLNQSKYLQNSLKANLQFESQFYLQIISDALSKDNVKPLEDKYSFLEKIVTASKNEKFVSITNKPAKLEIIKVQDLLNSYYLFILQDKVNFDQYIAHSKKIDSAINDLLVSAGLKTKGAEDLAPLDISSDDKQPASSTGTESSSSTYEDVEVKNPSLRQQAILASVKGLRLVESEIRRFIRMKVALSQGLELDTKEFMDDWKKTNSNQPHMSVPVNANPYGQRQGG